MSNEQFFSYIKPRTSCIWLGRWYLLCIRSTRL